MKRTSYLKGTKKIFLRSIPIIIEHLNIYIDDGIAFLKPIWAPNDNGIFTLKTSDNEYSILLPWSEKCLEIKIPQYLNGEATIIIETSDAFYSATTII